VEIYSAALLISLFTYIVSTKHTINSWKKIQVTGELSQGFTVHHKTGVLIDVRDTKLAD
jgi:hypothetical protein